MALTPESGVTSRNKAGPTWLGVASSLRGSEVQAKARRRAAPASAAMSQAKRRELRFMNLLRRSSGTSGTSGTSGPFQEFLVVSRQRFIAATAEEIAKEA